MATGAADGADADPAPTSAPAPMRLVGHRSTVYGAAHTPGGEMLATVSADRTLRFWDLETGTALFTLALPTEPRRPSPLRDLAVDCTADGAECWVAVPLIMGRVMLLRLDYGTAPTGAGDS
jgi:WD40 repeat protein